MKHWSRIGARGGMTKFRSPSGWRGTDYHQPPLTWSGLIQSPKAQQCAYLWKLVLSVFVFCFCFVCWCCSHLYNFQVYYGAILIYLWHLSWAILCNFQGFQMAVNESGDQVFSSKFRMLCELEWLSFGTGWPPEGSFKIPDCLLIQTIVLCHLGHSIRPLMSLSGRIC